MPIIDAAQVPRLKLATPERRPDRPGLTDARKAKIDALSVDRSHLAHYPLPRWSPDGERGDQRIQRRFRSDPTIAERIDALRRMMRAEE